MKHLIACNQVPFARKSQVRYYNRQLTYFCFCLLINRLRRYCPTAKSGGRICFHVAWISLLLLEWVNTADCVADETTTAPPQIKVGIIGLDTSHVLHFTKKLNAQNPTPELAGCRVVAAYPKGSVDIVSSTSRIPAYTEEIGGLGVKIVDSIDELLPLVDAVLLETNDGRPHLEQAIPVLKAGKRLFIDKPMASSLKDAIAIFDASEKYGAPVFSSSALRYGPETQAVRNGAIGDVLGCDTTGPCDLEMTHPDFAWYGIHGIESLFTVMGTGCQKVTRVHTDGQDIAVGVWDGGRIGSYRGMRTGVQSFAGIAFGTRGNSSMGANPGYEPLLTNIVAFFRGAEPPVSAKETIEILAFIEAADKSKQLDGSPINIVDVIDAARSTH